MESIKEYLTAWQVADKLDISGEFIRDFTNDKELKAVKTGK